jgi:hypothetical protein
MYVYNISILIHTSFNWKHCLVQCSVTLVERINLWQWQLFNEDKKEGQKRIGQNDISGLAHVIPQQNHVHRSQGHQRKHLDGFLQLWGGALGWFATSLQVSPCRVWASFIPSRCQEWVQSSPFSSLPLWIFIKAPRILISHKNAKYNYY